MQLPDDFLIGVSSSGHQIEGNNRHSDWWLFEQSGGLKSKDVSGTAADYWRRYPQDIQLLADLGLQVHRFGVEWSRVEPAPSAFDFRVLDRYAEMIQLHKRRGIKPYVALNHFTLPAWMAELGGWLAPEMVDRIQLYTQVCAQHFGADVDIYFTLNEPGTLASMGYALGLWPPQSKSVGLYAKVMRQMIRAHIRMAQSIRSTVPGAKVGIIKAWPRFLPYRSGHLGDRAYASTADWLFNGAFHSALLKQRLPPPLGWYQRCPGLRDSIDVYGLNFYLFFLGDLQNPNVQRSAHPGEPTSQLGWQPDPEGLSLALDQVGRLKKPILITENGIATRDETFRVQYIRDHLQQALLARDRGIDVRGYCYWSYIDNFEWAEGWRANFGLVGFDPQTMERQVRDSAKWLGELAQRREL